jgi:hypothetical protein
MQIDISNIKTLDVFSAVSSIIGATTFSITTLNITTIRIRSFYVTLSVRDCQHK